MNVMQTISADTRALVDLFAACSVGSTVTFGHMSDALGRSIKERRHLLPGALKIAARDYGAIFGSVRGVGYQRLAAEEAYVLGAHTRRRIRSSAKRTANAIVSAVEKANNLPEGAKARAYAEVNALHLVRHISADKQITATVAEAKPEPVAVVMRRFAEKMGAVS